MNRIGRRKSQKRKRGRGAGRGYGARGYCICTNPNCAHQVSHKRGVPCYKMKCPKCGSPMIRKPNGNGDVTGNGKENEDN